MGWIKRFFVIAHWLKLHYNSSVTLLLSWGISDLLTGLFSDRWLWTVNLWPRRQPWRYSTHPSHVSKRRIVPKLQDKKSYFNFLFHLISMHGFWEHNNLIFSSYRVTSLFNLDIVLTFYCPVQVRGTEARLGERAILQYSTTKTMHYTTRSNVVIQKQRNHI